MTTTLPSTIEQIIDPKALESIVANCLQQAKALGATACEVDCGFSEALSVSARKQSLENLSFHKDKSISITVYHGSQKATVNSTDISDKSLSMLIGRATELAQITEADDCAGLADVENLATDIPDCELYHPWLLSTELAIEMAMKAEQAAFDYDKRIENSDGASVYSTQSYHCYGNSNGFLAGYPSARHGMSCLVLAKEGDSMEREYDYTVSRFSDKLLDPEAIGHQAAKKAVGRLSPQQIDTKQCPVLFDASIAGGLFGHYLSAVSGGSLYRKASFLVDSLGNQIFPAGFAIEESPFLKAGLGSAAFDGEGVTRVPRHLVKDGKVETYLLSSYSARKMNMKTTGHSGGTTNLFVSADKIVPLEQLLSEMNEGVLVTELMGQGINLVTGDYSRGASGFWVSGGKIQYPINQFTIAGRLQDMYKGIQAIGTDIDERSTLKTGSVLIDNMMVAGSK